MSPLDVDTPASVERPRILFVDDEADVLAGLRRVLRPQRHQWDMHFVGSAREALDLLAASPFEVLVTDLRMPGIDGGELLAEVVRRHPDVVRIVLSGYADKQAALRSLGPMHQYLSKPCDADTLTHALARACRVRELLGNPELKRVVAGLGSIPSAPALYARLLDECRSSRGSVSRVAEIVGQDPGMTAKIMQLANSAFFALRQRVTSPVHAVQLLGMDTVQALALLAHVFSRFDGVGIDAGAQARLWRHSMAVASFARLIAAGESTDHDLADDAAVAGLLHDAGRLVLAASLGARYAAAPALAAQRGGPLVEAEAELFGAGHTAVGGYLLALWALPDTLVEAVTCHHTPVRDADRGFSALTAVHAADAIAHELEPADASEMTGADYATIAADRRFPAWREACRARAQGDRLT
jgi:HD-like signal output (HDOD) protein/CheY-like chemotaxis protein